jgi:di/tricarboxylate transporter
VSGPQLLLAGILLATVGLFLWGRWRHDMVAMGALLACVATGLVPIPDAFGGFGHPAVITVACVLVLSHGLQSSGAVDTLARRVLPASAGPTLSIALLTGLAAVLSSVMNNVGALALLLPVGLHVAARKALPPGRVLMPLAFGSILGGMTTLVGTPPNLIVSGFRVQTGAGAFAMFDFTPVGASVAAAGILFVALLGWRLVPARTPAGMEGFDTAAYLTEARVPEDSKAAGMPLREVEGTLEQADAQVVGLVRNDVRVTAPSPGLLVRAGDVLVVEAEAGVLADALSTLGLRLEEAGRPKAGEAADAGPARADAGSADAKSPDARDPDAKGADPTKEEARRARGSDEIVLAELVVLPQAALTGRSATDVQLRTRYGINLLAVSRQGRRSVSRLRTMPLRAGDVLLVQGQPEALSDFAASAGCVPLAERPLRIPDSRRAILAGAIMALTIAAAALGLLPAAVAYAAGVLASMALGTVAPRSVYSAIDWPVVVLLGALIPVAGAMETTGTADVIGRVLVDGVARGHATLGLAVILVVAMTLSDLMNNAATAAVMCPIAIGTAGRLGVDADPFLMAVAVGASCAFLTPIGHQNNTLILGPSGFGFGDYWRLGLPLELLVLGVSIPTLLLVWPL